ncbi:Beta-barrel assembly-enhancing protease [Usitatibacter rugosus]|uniref:Beta-barrel assembly-enhancing protease n=1 Tax=Usitatibacter rugosus TaxID=2732067 RepID=A0A6M4GRK6_9PROT|nr:M48 family metallopeptidase [Usitatibacter rugosus]QJR09706.1 Beta-barrel assembly-enhancing protease [Usitatibacter rugosus]
MSAFDADYFDGRSSRRHPVRAEATGGLLRVAGESIALEAALPDLRFLPRVGGTPLRIALPDGGLLVATDFNAVDAAVGVPLETDLAHRMESHARIVAAALAFIVGLGVFGYYYGIPWAADRIADRLPYEAETALSGDFMDAIDRAFFEPSKLEAARREDLKADFQALVAASGLPASTRVEFRVSKLLGANAVAIPGGTVIMTDALVKPMTDAEVVGVMAHELGHLKRRHGLRVVIGGSLYAVLSFTFLGDAGALASLASTAPQIIVQSGYSRDYEREADAYAVDLLRAAGRPPGDYAAALEALSRIVHKDGERRGSEWTYLSSHPDLAERIERAREAK